MTPVEQYFSYAETALAAYGVDLVAGGINSREYTRIGMGSQQAAKFNDRWLVLSQSSFNLNGFSAVLLQNSETGEKVLAIRGTNDPMDLATDLINIANFGTVLGMPQYYSLEAYYAQLVSTGLLGVNEQIAVTGHSLGGFLAQAFVARQEAVGAGHPVNPTAGRKTRPETTLSIAPNCAWTRARRRSVHKNTATNGQRPTCAAAI